MKKIITMICAALMAVNVAFAEGEPVLVVKPFNTVGVATDTNWGGVDAQTDTKYVMTYTGSTAEGDLLYECSMTLDAYFKTDKWENEGKHGAAPSDNNGWNNTYSYLVVYQDNYDTNEGTRQYTTRRTFTLTDDDTEVTFYARIAASDNTIRMVCDAQQLRVTGTSYQTLGNIAPAIGKNESSALIRFEGNKDNSVEMGICINASGNILHDFRDDSKKLRTTLRELNSVTLDYQTVTFSLNKILDGLQDPKIKVGNGSFENLTNDEFTIATPGTYYNNANPLIIGASIEGLIKAHEREKTPMFAGTIDDLQNDVALKLYYEIIPDGETEGSVSFIALSTEDLSLSCSDITTPSTSVWANEAGKNISSALSEGEYTLKIWFAAESYNTALYENIDLTSGVSTTPHYYTSTFTVGANTSIETTSLNASISSANGAINASFEGTAAIELYAVSGQLIAQTIADGNFSQAVQQGVYILKIDGNVYKIAVK